MFAAAGEGCLSLTSHAAWTARIAEYSELEGTHKVRQSSYWLCTGQPQESHLMPESCPDLRELCHTRCCDHQGHQSLVLRGLLLPWQSVKYTVACSINQIFIRKLTVFLHCGYFPLNEIVLFVSLFVFKRGNCVLTVLKAAKSPW